MENPPSFRDKVAAAIKKEFGEEKWFKGVCMDGVEHFEQRNDLDGAIEHAATETLHWDGEL